ncbi:unnamed protein product [Mytilus coruscus]|uniref:DDE Tnp4 domain-containing protein n=1 Tax=Mytilus coruscus TaxID=42192 RepID=A0A6J8BJT6_MYTCO|nr:unnamed protein product [Mytilus coruscus]
MYTIILVFYGKVLKEQVKKGPPGDLFDNETVRKYTMQVLYKMKGLYTRIDRQVVVQSPGNSAMCGMTLQVGQQYVIMGHRSGRKKMIRSCDFVKRTSSLSFEETFFIFTNGPYSYLKNCKDGCDDISDSSKECHFSHENYGAIDCLSGSALCHKEKNVCKWYNGDKCPTITVRPIIPTTPPFRPRPVMRRLDTSTVSRVLYSVLDALCEKRNEFRQWPTYLNQTKAQFYEIAGFPYNLDAVDGTHIRMMRPHHDKASFINRKGYTSLNVQAVCGAKGNVLLISSSHLNCHIVNKSAVPRESKINFRNQSLYSLFPALPLENNSFTLPRHARPT